MLYKPDIGDNFRKCTTISNVRLPRSLKPGFSASTGHLTDKHDIYGFSFRSISRDNYKPLVEKPKSTNVLIRLQQHLQNVHNREGQIGLDEVVESSGGLTELLENKKRQEEMLTNLQVCLIKYFILFFLKKSEINLPNLSGF